MNAGVFLRQAGRQDLAALAALEASCFSHPWTEAQTAQEMAVAPPGGVFVLEAAGRGGGPPALRAYCAFRLVLDEVHVMNLAVAPDARRRGLGRRLLSFVLRRAARAGAKTAYLELRAGNEGALALYEALGFRRLSRRRAYYRQPVEDALVLVLEGLAADTGDPAGSLETDLRRVLPCPSGGTGLLGPPPMSHPSQPEGLPDPQEARMSQETVSPAVHDEYRQLEAQHHQYESRLGELADKAVLNDEEQVEEITLKKKKLQIKDRMHELARRIRAFTAHP